MLERLLVANRGEIAVRIMRAAHDLDIDCVAVHASDDAESPHLTAADGVVALAGAGAAAYLDGARLIQIARAQGCDAVHPGYGFLSERADFAAACADAGLIFVGPTPAQLALFGDKARSRAFAAAHGVPVLPGTDVADLPSLLAFFASQRERDPHAAVMLKAVAGGGGRGMRVVTEAGQLAGALARCRAEALAAFGADAVYAERLLPRARHVEVQVLGDGRDVVFLGERDCTLQRRFQKLVEFAPSPGLDPALRARLADAALAMARASGYVSLGTFEFLLDASVTEAPFAFIETNPRLQVEHTVTEEVTGIDLVQAQLAIAAGQDLAAIGLDPGRPVAVRGFAVQWRLNAETLDARARARPGSGRITRCELPAGPGIRVDAIARGGWSPPPPYDTLLAKIVVSHRDRFDGLIRRSQRALDECRIEGIATNLPLLRLLSRQDAVAAAQTLHTRWLEEAWPSLHPLLGEPQRDEADDEATDAVDAMPAGLQALRAPMAGRIVQLVVAAGEALAAGAEALVIEAMKMQHGLDCPLAARVERWCVAPGDFVAEGQLLALLEPAGDAEQASATARQLDLDNIRPDLRRVLDRVAATADAARPEAVARRHASGSRTARENLADLCDPGSFIEYGAFAIAAQTRRRSVDDLVRNTPADGMIAGIGTVNAALFGAERARCAVLAYDYTVLAGTQGWRNHHKKDRLLGLALQWQLPLVLYAEGGGGRPGEVDMPVVAGLNNHTFSQFAALSGQVPVVGIVHGRCFAGNAALLGCADVIIATEGANIGMGGPAMIEGGGLGRHRPEAIGPAADLRACGVVDILVRDEPAATAAARQYLSYFQGERSDFSAGDQRLLRHLVPEQRQRVYDMRALLAALADEGSVIELRAGWGLGLITALVRIGGRPLGVFANNPQHLGGAIDPDAADKASRFMQLCEAHGLPILSLCDTPGFMVGPEIERQAQVRHACRMFVNAARLTVPCFTVVIRKGYGLGAQAMALGGFDAPVFTVAWPTGEFGAMGLEGAVKLGFRKELEAATDGRQREALYRQLVERHYANGSAIQMATTLEIDAVIDPAQTRDWLLRGLDGCARRRPAQGRRFIDGW